jgi:hypothetical protein
MGNVHFFKAVMRLTPMVVVVAQSFSKVLRPNYTDNHAFIVLSLSTCSSSSSSWSPPHVFGSNVKFLAPSEMGLLKFLQLCVCSAIMAVGVLLNSAEPTVLIRFSRAPPPQSRFSTAIFGYSVERLDGSNACKKNGCSIHCEVSFPFLYA